MTKLASWDDGYVIEIDGLRRDPLYYYMQEGKWGTGIGLLVEPRFKERTAKSVSIRVWQSHISREAGMEPAKRQAMYLRVVSSLVSRYSTWSKVTLQSSYLPEIMQHGPLSAVFEAAGFVKCTSLAPDENIWARPVVTDRRGLERSRMNLDRALLIASNVLARLFGVLAIFVGIVFLVSAYLFGEYRILDIVIGLGVTAVGLAFLLVKSLSAEQLARIRIRMRIGRPGSSERRH
jgi:hypothetical protein